MKKLENFKANQITNQEIKTINGGFVGALIVYVKDKMLEYGQSFSQETANIGQAATNGAVSVIK